MSCAVLLLCARVQDVVKLLEKSQQLEVELRQIVAYAQGSSLSGFRESVRRRGCRRVNDGHMFTQRRVLLHPDLFPPPGGRAAPSGEDADRRAAASDKPESPAS